MRASTLALPSLLAQVCYSSAEMGTTLRRVHLLLPSPEELVRYEVLLQTLVERRGRKPSA